nr:venom allergen 5-like [Onthophagus taurus]
MRGEVPGQPRGVGLNILEWDSDLAEEAQSWADNCVFQHNDVYDSRFPVGQNLYMSQSTSSSGPDWEAAIDDLYDEHRLYSYGEGFSYSAGHYTQLVWADTEYVGCGYSACDSGYYTNQIYVCNYGPAGNVMGEFPYKTAAYRKRKNSQKRKKNRKNRLNRKRKTNKKYYD